MLKTSRVLSILLLALPASAGTTWIVDDDGPADFSTIQAAIDAAGPGDVVRVMPGLYSNFFLDKALVVLGEPGAVVNMVATTWVLDVDTGTLAGIAGLQFVSSISVWDCDVPVVLDGLTTEGVITATLSSDVRVRGCETDGVGAYDGSRLEVSESTAIADTGWFGYPIGGPGGLAAFCSADSVLHIYRTPLKGGKGGPTDEFNGGQGGDGGNGITCAGELLLTGDVGHEVVGGSGGNPGGSPGTGMKLEAPAWARVSGVTVNGVTQGAGTTLEQPVPADPALQILAPAGPGEIVTFRVHAVPGASVQLNLGRMPVVQHVPGPTEDGLVAVLRTFDLGSVGASGVAGLNFKVPASAPVGFVFFGQARVTMPDGSTRYSNSVPVVVR